jgi:hypothetical protein
MKRILDHFRAHRATIVVTIEIFWVLVFLLHASTKGAGAAAAGFVYANF